MKQEQVQVQPSKTKSKKATARRGRLLDTDQRSPSGRTTYAN